MLDSVTFRLLLFVDGEPKNKWNSFQGSRRMHEPWLGGTVLARGVLAGRVFDDKGIGANVRRGLLASEYFLIPICSLIESHHLPPCQGVLIPLLSSFSHGALVGGFVLIVFCRSGSVPC